MFALATDLDVKKLKNAPVLPLENGEEVEVDDFEVMIEKELMVVYVLREGRWWKMPEKRFIDRQPVGLKRTMRVWIDGDTIQIRDPRMK